MKDKFFFPVEISKSYQDENGDWIVEGIASNGTRDWDGESIEPKGLDYKSYFLNKGFIKWEHGKNPENFIGEPLEAKITKDGFYIKGRLYKHAPLARQAVETIEALEKSGARRKIGFSIEGSVLERNPKNPKKILKAIVRNVALTANPVNDTTWAALVKSLNGSDALEFKLDDCEKAMDTAAGEATIPESLEMDIKSPFEEKDDKKRKDKIKRAFLRFLKTLISRKKVEKSLTVEDENIAFLKATDGLNDKEADEFFSLIIEKSAKINKIFKNIGGVTTMDELLKSIDDTIDELEKSLGIDTENDDNDEDDEDYKDITDDGVQKSFKTSLTEDDDTIEKALEVSDFLDTLVDTLTESIDGFNSELRKSLGQNDTIIKSLKTTAEVTKALAEEVKENRDLIKSLQNSIEEWANQPIGRRSVLNKRDLKTINKSQGDNNKGETLTKSQILDKLVEASLENKIDPIWVTKFETGAILPDSIQKAIGL